jgi:hypothetical protein
MQKMKKAGDDIRKRYTHYEPGKTFSYESQTQWDAASSVMPSSRKENIQLN